MVCGCTQIDFIWLVAKSLFLRGQAHIVAVMGFQICIIVSGNWHFQLMKAALREWIEIRFPDILSFSLRKSETCKGTLTGSVIACNFLLKPICNHSIRKDQKCIMDQKAQGGSKPLCERLRCHTDIR